MEHKLIEGIDYYMSDNGYKVFTEAYHLKRGNCCSNSCRHCPYKKDKNIKQNNASNIQKTA